MVVQGIDVVRLLEFVRKVLNIDGRLAARSAAMDSWVVNWYCKGGIRQTSRESNIVDACLMSAIGCEKSCMLAASMNMGKGGRQEKVMLQKPFVENLPSLILH